MQQVWGEEGQGGETEREEERMWKTGGVVGDTADSWQGRVCGGTVLYPVCLVLNLHISRAFCHLVVARLL